MNHKRPPIPVIIIVLATLGITAYFLYQQSLGAENGALAVSGTVEAVQVKVAPELGGKILEVNAAEGDTVNAGDVLFKLDPAILTAQRNAAAAALDTAKAAANTARAGINTAQTQLHLAVLAAQAEEQPLRAAQWRISTPTDFDQPAWYFTRDEQLTAARSELDAADEALQSAQSRLIDMRQKDFPQQIEYDKFFAAEQKLAAARAAYQSAKDILDRTTGATQELRDAAQTAFDDALADLEDAQADYDDLLDAETAQDILDARADLALAQERFYTARDRLRALQTGDLSPKLAAADAALEQAHRAYEQSQAAVAQAEAQIALLDAQIAKLTITAPSGGVVLLRNIEPGEFIAPGAAAFTLARVEDLTITIYVPENRYGEVRLGGVAEVRIDSFPGQTFSAIVIHIADRAEFTPRNVQTDEGRATTVYAIKLRVEDPGGDLKPGMPANVTFGE